MSQLQTKIKDLRVQADGLAKYVKDLPQSNQLEKATERLLIGKAWLGKLLAGLGVESPYPNDGTRHDVANIEQTADVAAPADKASLTYSVAYPEFNHIEKVDFLRQSIKQVIDEVLDIGLPDVVEGSFEYELARVNAYKAFSEARFWLGFELERIREEDTEPQVKVVSEKIVLNKDLASEALRLLIKHADGNLKLFLGKTLDGLKEVPK